MSTERWRYLTLGGPHEDAGLLVLRICASMPLLLKHGIEKIVKFQGMTQHFKDPIHIGRVPSLIYALVADLVCSILIMLGLGTRWAALISLVNLFVAWALVHQFAFFGRETGDHGEVIVLYMAATLAILVAGPGRYSLDALISRRKS